MLLFLPAHPTTSALPPVSFAAESSSSNTNSTSNRKKTATMRTSFYSFLVLSLAASSVLAAPTPRDNDYEGSSRGRMCMSRSRRVLPSAISYISNPIPY